MDGSILLDIVIVSDLFSMWLTENKNCTNQFIINRIDRKLTKIEGLNGSPCKNSGVLLRISRIIAVVEAMVASCYL